MLNLVKSNFFRTTYKYYYGKVTNNKLKKNCIFKSLFEYSGPG